MSINITIDINDAHIQNGRYNLAHRKRGKCLSEQDQNIQDSSVKQRQKYFAEIYFFSTSIVFDIFKIFASLTLITLALNFSSREFS